MATHQLYEGGPANPNIARTQWPSYTFNAADTKLQNVDIAQHYGTPYAVLRRVLDFKNDLALRRYFTDTAVAVADILNLILIPKGCLLMAAYVEVEAPANNGAITATFSTAGGLAFGGATVPGVAVDLTVAGARFSAANTAWLTANGTLALATAQGILTADMVQCTLASKATAGLAGFGNLRLNTSILVVQASENPATNF